LPSISLTLAILKVLFLAKKPYSANPVPDEVDGITLNRAKGRDCRRAE
jgi:hypothetical protein